MPLHRARIFVVRDYHQPRKGTPSSAAARSIRESTDNTARAELAERQAQELRRELEQQRKRADKADELAQVYRQGRDAALDELRELRPQRGHGLER